MINLSLILDDVSKFITSKVETSNIDETNYVSTENMLPNKGGVSLAASLPDTKSVRHYLPDDILINNIRPYFKKIWFANKEGGCSNDVFVLRANENYDSKFLYYVLSSDDFFSYVMANAKGTKMPRGDKKAIQNYIVPDFSIKDQITISHFLSNIDKKIEINKKINHNLETIIKKIYNNWFEDFEPFKNEEFFDTKLGKIPVGWKLEPLQNFIKFQEGPGIRNWQYVEENGVNFLNIRCIQDNDLLLDTANMISKEEAEGKYSHFMLNEWDIVISSSGTLGRYAIVRKEHLPLCLNTSIIRFAPKHSFNHYSYVYSYLTSRGFYHYLLTMGSGSVQLNFGPTHLKQIDLIVPPDDVLKEYNDLIFPLIEKMKSLKSEIDQLIKLRDTLLPKLMSGAIDVSKINCDLD